MPNAGVVVVLAALVASLSARSSAADPIAGRAGELGIAWQAPAACPDVDSVRARIEARLGRSLDDADGITIDVALADHRYVARVDLGAVTVANDVRIITSKRCDELADAVAVIVARAAGEHHRAPKPANSATSRGTADDTAANGTVHAPKPTTLAMRTADDELVTSITATTEAQQVRTWSLDVRLSGVSGVGVIPQVGLGGEIAVAVRRKHALAELAETRWMTSAAQLHTGGPAHVDVGLNSTALRLGWRPGELPLRAWASVEGGSMYGTGVALDNPQLGSGRWLAAGSGFGVAWPISRWVRLVGTTEVMVAIERVRFSLGDGIAVYAPSPMSARATCGLEIGLP